MSCWKNPNRSTERRNAERRNRWKNMRAPRKSNNTIVDFESAGASSYSLGVEALLYSEEFSFPLKSQYINDFYNKVVKNPEIVATVNGKPLTEKLLSNLTQSKVKVTMRRKP